MIHLQFFIPCIPPKATSQMKGAARTATGIRFFKKANVAKAENNLIALLRPHAPRVPLEGALKLYVRFVFPWRASEKVSVKRWLSECPNTTRPDCSNLIKMIEDAMGTLNFFHDDGQNSVLCVEKFWGDVPGIHVCLSSCEGTPRA